MKEPKPLLREGATDFERRLLSAALGERPSPRLQAQMRRGIGLTGPLVWAGSAKAMLGTLVGKSVIGAVGLVAAGGLAVAVTRGAAPTAAAPRAETPSMSIVDQRQAAAVPAAPEPAASSAPAAGNVSANTGVAPAASAQVTVPATAAAADDVATDSEDSASNGQLREEIRLLDQARGALQRGSAKDARSVLDEYRERFPAGILGREANVLSEQARSRGTSHAGAKERATPQHLH